MTSTDAARAPEKRKLWAHLLPMLTFILLLGVSSALKRPGASPWLSAPELWIYPLQTVLCAALLTYFWRDYEFHPWRRPLFTIAIALVVFALWIGPQQFLHFPARLVGFNPDTVAGDPPLYWATLTLRFARLVIVVPLVEEIFWRSLLLRYVISEKFQTVPFGAFSWMSFAVVAVAFALSHQMADWPAALVAGVLYNLVACGTKSLTSCVAVHAVTNLALGLWIAATKQWGFW
jgi:CAAX prenyl protease-like protein